MVSRMHGRSRRRGFTLVELLVAMAIIAVLAALIVSTVVMCKRRALLSHCASNLSQIGKALSMYWADYDGYFPAAYAGGLICEPEPGEWRPPQLDEMLAPYTEGNPGIFVCPASFPVRPWERTYCYVMELGGLNEVEKPWRWEFRKPFRETGPWKFRYVDTYDFQTDDAATLPVVLDYHLAHDGGPRNVLYGDLHVKASRFWGLPGATPRPQ